MKQVTQKYIAWLSWRRPWVWLLAILLIYPFVLAVIAPLVIKSQLENLVENRLQLQLDVADISVHPYVLSLSIKDVKISGENLGEPIGFEQLFVNFQLWDSLQGTWTLKEAYLTGVYGEFKRLTKETHNFTNVINTWVATEEKKSKEKKAEEKKPEEKSAEAIDEPAEFPRVRIDDLRLQIAAFKFIDDVPKSGFETAIGPIDFHIEQLSSLPNTAGQQTLLLKTVAGAELAWQGSISLSPFSSEGDVILIGPILTTLADYLKDDINVAVTTDNFQAGFHYVINKPEQGDLKIQLSGIEASLRELSVKHHPTNDSLFLLNDIQVSDGELSWPESSIRLGKIQLTGGEVWAKMSLDGNLNFSQLVAADDNDDEQESTWQLANDSLLIQGITLHYLDESSTSPAPVAVENISLDVKNLSNKPEQRVDVNAGFSLLGGQFESTARAQLNPFGDAEGTYKIAQLPVKAAQSFIDDYAAIEIMSGELDAEGKITTSNNAVKIQGNAHIDNVNVREKSNGKTILTWAQLKLNRIIANLDEKKINLGRVQFDQAFADFDIAADGTHTLTRILKIDEPTPETDEPENASSTQASSTDTSSFSFLIGRIDFENASGNFSDATLPLPFSADVAKINGTISTLDSTSHAPAKVKLEGQVSDYGEMVMTGDIFPLEPKQKTRMNVNFNNIDISEFSPYAIKFAGREIAKGKMDLDLEYDINQSRMRGKNHIVLHDFALGKKVEQAGAVDLPLDLAIALLKDKDGVIRTDLPVEGNVDDPKFDYGTTIRQAVRKLITNVAAAPFRFLAGLVGVGQNKDLGYISFFAGRTDLSPAQNEKIKQLGEALIKRPDLQITISGVYLASFDTAELQEEKFEARLREQLSKGLADANIGSRKYISTMEKLYSEKGLTPDLNELKRNAQRLATDDNQNVDQLSYIKAVKDKLVATEIITQEDLLQLAASRAQVLYQNLTQIPQVNAAQIKMGEAREGQLNKDNKIKLELGANLKKKTKAKKT
jgi:hypothetical protein